MQRKPSGGNQGGDSDRLRLAWTYRAGLSDVPVSGRIAPVIMIASARSTATARTARSTVSLAKHETKWPSQYLKARA
jgi:hypothetical protein